MNINIQKNMYQLLAIVSLIAITYVLANMEPSGDHFLGKWHGELPVFGSSHINKRDIKIVKENGIYIVVKNKGTRRIPAVLSDEGVLLLHGGARTIIYIKDSDQIDDGKFIFDRQ